MTSPTHLERARSYLQLDQDQLARVAEQLDDSFSTIVEVVRDLKGNVIFTGMGKSFHIGSKVSATFTSTGTPSTTLHPTEALHGDLGILQDGDCVFLLSYSGASAEILQLVPLLRRRDVTLISITGSEDNPLAKLTDHQLCVNIEREACPFNLAPTTSALVTLAVCDTIAMLVQEDRGFTQADYRQLHPGGAIGATLSLRVRDVMRTGDRLATCKADDNIQEAIFTMTRCKSGAVGVIDDDGHVLGVFTDGDLRRAFSSENGTSAPLQEVMTANPICLKEGDKIQSALDVFSCRNIDDLLVVNETGQLVGIVDLQDLPKLKLLPGSNDDA